MLYVCLVLERRRASLPAKALKSQSSPRKSVGLGVLKLIERISGVLSIHHVRRHASFYHQSQRFSVRTPALQANVFIINKKNWMSHRTAQT